MRFVGVVADKERQRSDSGTYVERTLRGCVGTREGCKELQREKRCYSGSGGQGGSALRIEELMTRSGPGSGLVDWKCAVTRAKTLTHSLKAQ